MEIKDNSDGTKEISGYNSKNPEDVKRLGELGKESIANKMGIRPLKESEKNLTKKDEEEVIPKSSKKKSSKKK